MPLALKQLPSGSSAWLTVAVLADVDYATSNWLSRHGRYVAQCLPAMLASPWTAFRIGQQYSLHWAAVRGLHGGVGPWCVAGWFAGMAVIAHR